MIGVDDDSWTVIKECRDVHKSEALITELLIAFQCLWNKLYVGQLSSEDKEDFDALSIEEQSEQLAAQLGPFLESIKRTDQTLGLWVDFFEAGLLGLLAWEAQRLKNHHMYMFSLKGFLKELLFLYGRKRAVCLPTSCRFPGTPLPLWPGWPNHWCRQEESGLDRGSQASRQFPGRPRQAC